VRRGGRDRAEIALTFDDGPNPPFTDRILEILARYAVPATFFCVGMSADARPAEVSRLLDAGHTVGNHTWSHPYLPDLSRIELAGQIERTAAALTRAGCPTPTLFRPPYGSRSPDVLAWLPDMATGTVLWDVDAGDWAMPTAPAISRAVLDGAEPGSIVLLHDGGGDRSATVAALPGIIEGLLARGYRLVTVDRML
jgi:peptidoglycan/xylan/chitin deacetylase (PgdA/CDA1 family)